MRSLVRIERTSPFQSCLFAHNKVANFLKISISDSVDIELAVARMSRVILSRDGDLDSELSPNNSFSGTW